LQNWPSPLAQMFAIHYLYMLTRHSGQLWRSKDPSDFQTNFMCWRKR